MTTNYIAATCTLAVALALGAAAPPAIVQGSCPETCHATPDEVNWFPSDFTATWGTAEDGTGKVENCETCTHCKVDVGFIYTGTLRWIMVDSGGGVTIGAGSFVHAESLKSECDDPSPAQISVEVGINQTPALYLTLFCPC